MASKVPATHPVLWPFLLEFVCDTRYNSALLVLSKSITSIAEQKRAAGDYDYNIDFEHQVNVPKPQELMCRMMIMAAAPAREPGMGVVMVNMMGALGPIVDPAIGTYWDESASVLRKYLESSEDVIIYFWKYCCYYDFF